MFQSSSSDGRRFSYAENEAARTETHALGVLLESEWFRGMMDNVMMDYLVDIRDERAGELRESERLRSEDVKKRLDPNVSREEKMRIAMRGDT